MECRLRQIEKKISKPSFETWLKSTKAHSLKGDTLIVIAPNEFAEIGLRTLFHLISGILYEITGEEFEVKFIIPQNQNEEDDLMYLVHQKRLKKGRRTS